MNNKIKKTNKILARIGFEDKIVPIDDLDCIVEKVTPQYLVGYEDEDGNECKEDGTYLNQKIKI